MKAFSFLLIFCLSGFILVAQEQDQQEPPKKGFQKERLFFGGNFGLTFGDYTLINVSPQIGYRFTDRLAAGMGINMQYVRIKQQYDTDSSSKKSIGIAGFNVFGRAYPIRQFFVQLQPEINYKFGREIIYGPRSKQRYIIDAEIIPSILAGGGMAFPTGRGAFLVSIFYDVLQHEDSPYGKKPVYTFGYNIGF